MRRITEQLELSPKPTDGQWSPKNCYYALGERVTIEYGWPGEVVAYTRSNMKRIGYIVKLDTPIEGKDEWDTLLEDIEGGPWHKNHPHHSHNIEMRDALPRSGCAISTCEIHL